MRMADPNPRPADPTRGAIHRDRFAPASPALDVGIGPLG